MDVNKKMSLKLLIDKSAQKVLYAEAGKDFVDFLFRILSVPIGQIIKLLNEKQVDNLGITSLCQSFENFNNDCLQPNMRKDMLLNPNTTNAPSLFYGASSRGRYGTSSTSEGGYVKGLVTYMVTDDLSVSPLSMISGISVMNRQKIRDFDRLQEKEVQFGFDEGLQLLKASLQTKEALTYVYLTDKKQGQRP